VQDRQERLPLLDVGVGIVVDVKARGDVGMRGIDEHDGRDVSRELTGEDTNGESARRPSDEYIGRLHVRDPQRFVQLEGKLLAGPRQWAGFAPTKTGAVV
jgi:hypothetical protein